MRSFKGSPEKLRKERLIKVEFKKAKLRTENRI